MENQNPDALLKYAVEQAVMHINHDRLEPQAALTKVATDLQLNHNFIKRAAEALNVALTYNHMKTATDKAADFPIVDAKQVVEHIYGQKEKTASEFKADSFSSNQSSEVTPKFDRYLNDPRYKAAYAAILATVAPDSHEMSVGGIYEKSANYIRDLRKAEDEAVSKRAGCDWDANQAFCDVLGMFSKSAEYRTSWPDFETQVFSKHGAASCDYLDLLYRCAKIDEPRGMHSSRQQMIKRSAEAVAFDSFITKAAELRVAVKTAEEVSANHTFERNYVSTIFRDHRVAEEKQASAVEELTALKELEARRKKFKPTSEVDPVLKKANEKCAADLDAHEEVVKKAFSFVDSAMDQYKATGTANQPLTSGSDADNLQRKFILQELATTDPILRGIDPQKLVDHYSQMLAIAPELAKEKEIVRSTLRSMSASQALGPFEGQQLMQANNEILKQRAMALGRPPQGQSGGKD